MSDAAAQLQPVHYACGTQRALLPIAVGSMNINELMNINDVRESATLFPCPCKLTFDLLTLKVVSESRVTWAICVCANFGLPRPLCSRVIPDVRDRQTDVRQHHLLMPPPRGRGHNKSDHAVRREGAYRIADVGVDAVLDVFQHFVEVPCACGTQEAGVTVSLRTNMHTPAAAGIDITATPPPPPSSSSSSTTTTSHHLP